MDPLSTSRLLQLPGEIRNSIYGYVLTMENGILYFENKESCVRLHNADFTILPCPERIQHNEYHLVEHFQEINQLKFVSRQLYHETMSLTMKHNDLSFETGQQLVDFIGRYPEQDDLRCLTMRNGFSNVRAHHNHLAALMYDFCRKNPHVLVRCMANQPPLDAAFILRAAIVELKFRGSTELMKSAMASSHYIYKTALDLADGSGMGAPDNFRLFPRVLESMTEEEALRSFKEACEKSEILQQDVLPGVPGGFDQWMMLMKQIMRNGI